MSKVTQTPKTEKILSVRRAIEEKKTERGLTSPILTLKTLKKYRDLDHLTYPKSLLTKRTYKIHQDHEGRFKDSKYRTILGLEKNQYVFDKLVADVAKVVANEIEQFGTTESTSIESELIAYMEKLGLNDYRLRKLEVTDDFKEVLHNRRVDQSLITDDSFAYVMFSDLGLSLIREFWAMECPRKPFATPHYFSLKGRISVSKTGRYRGKGRLIGKFAYMMDFPTFIARAMLCQMVGQYLGCSQSNREKVKVRMDQFIDHTESDNELFFMIDEAYLLEVFKSNPDSLSDYFRSLIGFTLESMLQEATVLTEYEERLKKVSGTYATSYITKKNIPQKIQDYMSDNRFLEVFGYVEADEQCDLNVLKALEEQFVEFSKQFPLFKVADHSLRFRRLGKIKAAGVYYPGANSLAVNLDNMDAFTHEFFHLIDFTQGILSLNDEFKPLFHHYCELTESLIEQLPTDHSVVIQWNNTSSKYSKKYFNSPEEAFARMGEIYVANCLGIDSSFNQSHFKTLIIDPSDSNQNVDMDFVVYPQEESFVQMVKDYFDRLFEQLKETQTLVDFETSSSFNDSVNPVEEPTLSSETKQEVLAMWDEFSGKGVQLTLF